MKRDIRNRIGKRILLIGIATILGAMMSTLSVAARGLDGGFIHLSNQNASWSENHWETELEAMRTIGMNTIIISNSVYSSYSYYSICSLSGVTTMGDPVYKIMEIAQAHNMKVILGMYSDGYWWSVGKDSTFLTNLYSQDTQVINDLWSRYSSNTALLGFYICQETDNGTFNNEANRVNLARYFLSPVSAYVKSLSPNLHIGIAPYIYPVWSTPEYYGDWWVKTFNDATSLDLLIPQDGVGAFANTFSQVSAYFRELKRACDTTGRIMWSDLEIFDNTTTWGPTPIGRVTTQILSEDPYVTGFTCWEYINYISPYKGSEEEGLYIDYLRYLFGNESTYQNVARGKGYTVSPSPVSGYPDDHIKLTDGVSGFDYPNNVGWYEPASSPTVILDLGEVKNGLYEVKSYSMRADDAWVDLPVRGEVYSSTDGTTYTFQGYSSPVDTMNHETNIYRWKGTSFSARYIKLVLIPSSARFVFINEILVSQSYQPGSCIEKWKSFIE